WTTLPLSLRPAQRTNWAENVLKKGVWILFGPRDQARRSKATGPKRFLTPFWTTLQLQRRPHKRRQRFLRVLHDAVVVFGTGDGRVQAEADRQGVGPGLGSSIRVGRVDPGIFPVGALEDRPVDFVGRDVDEPLHPVPASIFQNVVSAEN